MVAMEELRFTGRSQSYPERAPGEKKKYKGKFFLTIAPWARVCHEIASLPDVNEDECTERWRRSIVRIPSSWHIVLISRFKHKKDVCARAICRTQTKTGETSCFDGRLENENSWAIREVFPPRAGNRRVLLLRGIYLIT